jgi:hypothetical protein
LNRELLDPGAVVGVLRVGGFDQQAILRRAIEPQSDVLDPVVGAVRDSDQRFAGGAVARRECMDVEICQAGSSTALGRVDHDGVAIRLQLDRGRKPTAAGSDD